MSNQTIFTNPKLLENEGKKFAEDNDVEYVKEINVVRVFCGLRIHNSFVADKNRYIVMTPPNTGYRMGEITWSYVRTKYDEAILLDNQRAFREITNLTELLIKLTKVFINNFDSDYYLNPNYIGLKLTGELKKNYKGEAQLVFTDECIKKVVDDKSGLEKIEVYNRFLDCFISWNFGYNFSESQELRDECNKLSDLLKNVGMRKRITSGFDVWSSDYVRHCEID